MTSLFEKLIAKTWNGLTTGSKRPADSGLFLGYEVVEDQVTSRRVCIPHSKRSEHLALLGKTGQGKSRLLHHMASQDIESGSGFVYFDLHGDSTPFLLSRIAEVEQRLGVDMSARLIVIEPADGEYSVGLNLLERQPGQDLYVQIAEFTQILKARWHLESFGARTEELLRNSLHALAECGMTLAELPLLLSNTTFRGACIRRIQNIEVAAYFTDRFNAQSDAMQAAYRDPILNKISGFIVDQKFRHILGQHSTFSLIEAIDHGYFVILHLDKARLGEQAATFAGLLLTRLKNALFARRSRRLVTLYCDEIQNLVAADSGLETLLSEARKFSVSVVSANQFTEQHPPPIRAALSAIGAHVYFQLSGQDADKVAASLDGGKKLAELLKNLPKRHIIVKSGHEHYRHALVPSVPEPRTAWADLYRRCRVRWARRRQVVEAEIRQRQPQRQTTERALNDWE